MENHQYMSLALELAGGMKGQTSPNPMVGCVIVKDGRVVGLGSHLQAGGPHAEIHALTMAGDEAKGATAYVTLEPCSHYGKTPPCSDALIRSEVKKVVVATLDPNPLVAGNGIAKLKEAGIEVVTGVLEEQSTRLNEVFNTFIKEQRPFVTVKTASTLDGKVATETGSSRWVTGEQARLDVHRMRHQHDAILVGVNTVITDDPQLTTRLPEGGGKNPIRIIMDTTLRIPLHSRVIMDGEAPTWIITTDRADPLKKRQVEEKGIRVFSTGAEPKVHIPTMLELLGKEMVSSLLVEGGSQINSAFLHGRAIDKVISYFAPKLVAGQGAPTPFGGTGIEEMGNAVAVKDIQVEMLGQDIKITGYPDWGES